MKSFEETIKGAMVGSDTKKVVRAASKGDLDAYKIALTSYSWPCTRDYSMVLLILSPIVAVIKAAEKRGDTESTDPRIAELERRVNAILGKQKFKDLCTAIGAGNGDTIWSTLDLFKNYKELLKLLSNDRYGTGGSSDKFMIRAKKITSWMSANKTFINTKLIPFVRDTLGIRFSTAFGQGLSHAPSAPVASGPAAAAATTTTTTTTTTTATSSSNRPGPVATPASTITTLPDDEPDEAKYPHVYTVRNKSGKTAKNDEIFKNGKYDLMIAISCSKGAGFPPNIVIHVYTERSKHEYREYSSLITKLETLHKHFPWLLGREVQKQHPHETGYLTNHDIYYDIKSWDVLEEVADKLVSVVEQIAQADNFAPRTFIYISEYLRK